MFTVLTIVFLVILSIILIWSLIQAVSGNDIIWIWVLTDCLFDIFGIIGEILSSIDWNSND